MSSSTDVQRHIRARPGDVARYVLIPGDPGRAFCRRDDGLDAVLSDSNTHLPQRPTQAEEQALFQRVEANTITIAMRAATDLHAAQLA